MTRGIEINSYIVNKGTNLTMDTQQLPKMQYQHTSNPPRVPELHEAHPVNGDLDHEHSDVFALDIDGGENSSCSGEKQRRRHPTEPSVEIRHSIYIPDVDKSSSYEDVSRFTVGSSGVEEADGLDDVDGIPIPGTLKKTAKRFSIPSLFKGKDKTPSSSTENMSEIFSGSLPRSKTFTSEAFDRFKSISKSFGKGSSKVKKTKSSADVKSMAPVLTFTDKIYDYPARLVGVFLLIANFTSDLKGYNTDRADIRKFFADKLGYKFIEVTNCTQAQMFKAIDMAKDKIRELNDCGQKVNRLIVTILTHGEEKGIHTCQDGGGQLKEKDEDGNLVVTNLENIIAKVKHDRDNLPELKGHPKLFFIQSCFGEEIVRAAGGMRSNIVFDQSDGDDENLIYQPTLPVDTDLFVASASTKYNKAFVSKDDGSWFIRAMLAVFRKLYKTKDVESLFKAVTFEVSEIRKAYTLENGDEVVAAQVPVRQSTLRKNCYL